MRVARQVDVVLQNHTQELLTVEGGYIIQGDWNQALGPLKLGSVVPRQASTKWSSTAPDNSTGCEADVRLGCTKGYIEIHWLLPVSAKFRMVDLVAPEGLRLDWREDGPNDDYRVVLVTLTPASPAT